MSKRVQQNLYMDIARAIFYSDDATGTAAVSVIWYTACMAGVVLHTLPNRVLHPITEWATSLLACSHSH